MKLNNNSGSWTESLQISMFAETVVYSKIKLVGRTSFNSYEVKFRRYPEE